MELDRITILLDKYFEAETTIAEENELKGYFAGQDVAQHLQQYRPMFGFFSQEAAQQPQNELILPAIAPRRKAYAWMSAAASVLVLLGLGTFAYVNSKAAASQDLGTYNDPETAFRETQKALSLLSNNVNAGVESVQYLQQYENAKEKVFQ